MGLDESEDASFLFHGLVAHFRLAELLLSRRGVDVKHKRVPATGPAFCSGQCGPTIQIQYGPRTGILPRIDTIHL